MTECCIFVFLCDKSATVTTVAAKRKFFAFLFEQLVAMSGYRVRKDFTLQSQERLGNIAEAFPLNLHI